MKSRKEKSKEFQILAIGDLHFFLSFGYRKGLHNTEIEILILPDGRNLISHYYQHLIDGYFDAEIQRLRAEAKPIFEYIGLNAYSKL